MSTIRYAAILPLLVGLLTVGCSVDDGNDGTFGDNQSKVTSGDTTKLGPGTYANDPRIVTIRKEVNAIEASDLSAKEKGICDGYITKFTDTAGAIRKIVQKGGQANIEVTSTVYYNAAGQRPIFVFVERNDGEVTWQSRLYFGSDGEVLIEVIRPVNVEHPFDRLPTSEEALDFIDYSIHPNTRFERDCR